MTAKRVPSLKTILSLWTTLLNLILYVNTASSWSVGREASTLNPSSSPLIHIILLWGVWGLPPNETNARHQGASGGLPGSTPPKTP